MAHRASQVRAGRRSRSRRRKAAVARMRTVPIQAFSKSCVMTDTSFQRFDQLPQLLSLRRGQVFFAEKGGEKLGPGPAEQPADEAVCLLALDLLPADEGRAEKARVRTGDSPFVKEISKRLTDWER